MAFGPPAACDEFSRVEPRANPRGKSATATWNLASATIAALSFLVFGERS